MRVAFVLWAAQLDQVRARSAGYHVIVMLGFRCAITLGCVILLGLRCAINRDPNVLRSYPTFSWFDQHSRKKRKSTDPVLFLLTEIVSIRFSGS